MWDKLKAYREGVANRPILSLFDTPNRAQTFSARFEDLLLDYSKTNLDTSAIWLLISLAESAGLPARRDAMFAGEKINETEGRAVLHTALRAMDGGPIRVDSHDVMPEVSPPCAGWRPS